MRPDIADIVRGADIGGWRPVEIEHGDRTIEVLLPPGAKTLTMTEFAPLARPADEIRRSLEDPVGTPPLARIVAAKGKPPGNLSVCITTSDITRPVPYKGESGILDPLLRILHGCGVRKENVTLLVGTGTHRPSTAQEKVAMFGERVAAEYRIIDHVCDDDSMLTDIGRTRSGTEIQINRHFIEADVKIATGLVESHFMAGVSAGRKAICPALVSRKDDRAVSQRAVPLLPERHEPGPRREPVPRGIAGDRPQDRGGFHRQHRPEPPPRADRRLLRRPRAVPRQGGGTGPPRRGDPRGAGVRHRPHPRRVRGDQPLSEREGGVQRPARWCGRTAS